MFESMRTILHPAWYQGRQKRPPYFEGWYFKLVDRTEQQRYAIIPGVFRAVNHAASHAFIQVLDGTNGEATYHRYDLTEFQPEPDHFSLRIGASRFGAEGIDIEIDDANGGIIGRIDFGQLVPWPVTLVSPGIMGWYAWVPFMECYHGVLSLDHPLSGSFSIGGTEVDLDGGRGYIEKDWGRAFPTSWVWMQSNHFQVETTSLTASVATIPWLGGGFNGFIAGLWHDGKLHRFATHTGAKLRALEIQGDSLGLVLQDRRKRLDIVATRATSGAIMGPNRQGMGVRVLESLLATIDVQLWDISGGQPTLVYEGQGRNAGLEVGGAIEKLAAVQTS